MPHHTKTKPSQKREGFVVSARPLYCPHTAIREPRGAVQPTDDLRGQDNGCCLSAQLLTEDAAMTKDTDRYAWASHYLQEMSKAVIDDVVKVLESPGNIEA